MKHGRGSLWVMTSVLAVAATSAGCSSQSARPLDSAVLAAAKVVQPDDARRADRNQADSQLGYALLTPVDAQGSMVIHPLPPKQGAVVVGLPLAGVPLAGASLSLTAAADNACLEHDLVVSVGVRSKAGQIAWTGQAVLGPDHRTQQLKVMFDDQQDTEQLAIGVRMVAAAANNFCAAVAVRDLTISK